MVRLERDLRDAGIEDEYNRIEELKPLVDDHFCTDKVSLPNKRRHHTSVPSMSK
jgi:hypothetical protein